MTRQSNQAKGEKVKRKAPSTAADWESGKLGESEEHMEEAGFDVLMALDEALELKPISIRLQRKLVERLKLVAKYHGIGYQPLVRDILNRWVTGEMKSILQKLEEQAEAEKVLADEDSPYAKTLKECA
jgi:predicted DNA binding CopG/RHH family protein